MMEACGFMSSFSFCYSDRPGARAALFPDKIPPEVQQERLLRLQALQDRLSQRWLDARVDREICLLIEGRSRKDGPDGESSWQGRDPYGALVHVALPPEADHTGAWCRCASLKPRSTASWPDGRVIYGRNARIRPDH